jgi:hypothetical protein
MQNQKIELLDVLKIIRQDSIQEASENTGGCWKELELRENKPTLEADRKFKSFEKATELTKRKKWENEKK